MPSITKLDWNDAILHLRKELPQAKLTMLKWYKEKHYWDRKDYKLAVTLAIQPGHCCFLCWWKNYNNCQLVIRWMLPEHEMETIALYPCPTEEVIPQFISMIDFLTDDMATNLSLFINEILPPKLNTILTSIVNMRVWSYCDISLLGSKSVDFPKKSYSSFCLQSSQPCSQNGTKNTLFLEINCHHRKNDTMVYWRETLQKLSHITGLKYYLHDKDDLGALSGLLDNFGKLHALDLYLTRSCVDHLVKNDILVRKCCHLIRNLQTLRSFSLAVYYPSNGLPSQLGDVLLDTVWNHPSIVRIRLPEYQVESKWINTIKTYLKDRTKILKIHHLELSFMHNKKALKELILSILSFRLREPFWHTDDNTITRNSRNMIPFNDDDRDDWDPSNQQLNTMLQFCQIQQALLASVSTSHGLYPYVLAKLNGQQHVSKLFCVLRGYANWFTETQSPPIPATAARMAANAEVSLEEARPLSTGSVSSNQSSQVSATLPSTSVSTRTTAAPRHRPKKGGCLCGSFVSSPRNLFE